MNIFPHDTERAIIAASEVMAATRTLLGYPEKDPQSGNRVSKT